MKRIGVLQGDYIGPEITREAIKVLKEVACKYNYDVELEYIVNFQKFWDSIL